MNGGKMIGTVLALMIAGIKRISQVFGGFKSVDMLEIFVLLKGCFNCKVVAEKQIEESKNKITED